MNGYTAFAWQLRFHNHIILDNPAKWELDRDNPEKRAYETPG
jgi:hypothetical protein